MPEQATPDQIDARRRRAEEALPQIKGGKDFNQVAAAFSDAPDALRAAISAGARRRACRSVFVERACKDMKKGDVSPVLRSPGGFHIVKLNDDAQPQRAHGRRADARAAHPGRVNETTSEAEGKAKIERMRDRIDTRRQVRGSGAAQLRGRVVARRAATSAG